MEILGLLTIALVAGTLARTLYGAAIPVDVAPSLALGSAAVAAGLAIDVVTGVGDMTSPASLASWVTALTCACLLVVVADVLRSVARPLRAFSRAS